MSNKSRKTVSVSIQEYITTDVEVEIDDILDDIGVDDVIEWLERTHGVEVHGNPKLLKAEREKEQELYRLAMRIGAPV